MQRLTKDNIKPGVRVRYKYFARSIGILTGAYATYPGRITVEIIWLSKKVSWHNTKELVGIDE